MGTESTSTPTRKACSACGTEYTDGDLQECPKDGTKLVTLRSHLAPGTVLADRYEIVDAVADGGMGKVYKARHKLMKRTVAIKTILPNMVASGAMLKRFQQEAEAVSQLNHPNILTVFDFFIADDGQPYLVMDYIEGSNLEKINKTEGKLAPLRAAKIFRQVCDGMAHAHKHGVIHRDLKPANIMLVDIDGQDDAVKIIDFGIARLESEGKGLTATGDTFGSPQFMSPEQCRAKPVDARSDIYSLGAVMYYSFTGRLPFDGEDQIQCMYKQVHEQAAPFGELGSDDAILAAFEPIVHKAMEKEPEQRYQSMEELRTAIDDAQSHISSGQFPPMMDTGARQMAAVTIPDAPLAATAPDTSENLAPVDPPPIAPPSKKPVILAALGSALVVGLGLGIPWMVSVNRSKPTPQPRMYQTRTTDQDPQPNVATTQGQDNSLQPAPNNAPATSTTTSGSTTNLGPTPLTGTSSDNPAAAPVSTAQRYANQLADAKKAFNEGDIVDAQKLFNIAHRTSEQFGEADSRFVDSLEWQGRVAERLGNYQQARQAYEWVLYARKSKPGHKTADVAEVQRRLDALHH